MRSLGTTNTEYPGNAVVIDSSALVAILFREPERNRFIEAIENDPVRLISSVNALESSMVLEARKHDLGGWDLDRFLHRSQIRVAPVTEEHFEVARQAWRKYGKGNHPAGLNLADCCAYALSRCTGEALLFKGDDFSQTDVVPALAD